MADDVEWLAHIHRPTAMMSMNGIDFFDGPLYLPLLLGLRNCSHYQTYLRRRAWMADNLWALMQQFFNARLGECPIGRRSGIK